VRKDGFVCQLQAISVDERNIKEILNDVVQALDGIGNLHEQMLGTSLYLGTPRDVGVCS